MASPLAQAPSAVLNSVKARHVPGRMVTPSAVPCLRTTMAGTQLRLGSSQQAHRTRTSSIRCASSEPRPSSSFFPDLEGEDGGPLSRALAVGSVSTAVALFLFTRIAGAAPDLSILAAQSTPYDAAMADSRPTMVEFYADWCEVCKEMARDVSKVEERFKGKVNFVMINVDNPRYLEEMDEFGVDGIPHFVFLDSAKNEQGFVVGRMPRRILAENLAALANGDPQLPHSQLVGAFTDSLEAPPVQASPADANAVASKSLSGPAPAIEQAGTVQDTAPPPSIALATADVAAAPLPSLFDFEVENIKGQMVSLGDYKGKVSLVVNVASRCGLTDSNYKGLTQLYDKYKEQGFEVLAFPCNQFLKQEPGSNEQIENFACSRYKATYPLFSKIEVNGPGTAPLYQFLKSQQGQGADISWNFEKFLVDKSGNVVKRYSPTTPPLAIEDDLRALL